MSYWGAGNCLDAGASNGVRDALKDVTNTPSIQDEGGWGKPSAYDDGACSTKDYGGYGGYDGDAAGKPSGGCFRCGSEDHMKNECPKKPAGGCFKCGADDHMKNECHAPPKPSGECFNCVEIGHNEAEFPNERVARPFTGTCKLCQEEGHRVFECPTAPIKFCKNCEQPEGEDHTTSTCNSRRKIQRDPIKDGQAEQAWKDLIAASKEGDMDDVKEAMKLYTDALPEVTYVDLEDAFRNMNIPVYLVAIEKHVINSFTVVDLQGNIDETYVVWIRKSPNPSRPYEAEMWPPSPEENMERLKDAGVVESRRAVRCSGCGELGHTRKHCQDFGPQAVTQGSVIHCYNCDEDSHRCKDCPRPREDKNACRNCKQPEHQCRECTEPRSLDNVNSSDCGEMGHFARDCPTSGGGGGSGGGGCFNCDATGHQSRECPLPRDYSHVKCKTCGQMGHTAVRCKDAPAGDDFGGDFGDGGGFGASANSWDNSSRDVSSSGHVPAKTLASGWAKISKGGSVAGDDAGIAGDGGWGTSTNFWVNAVARPATYASHHNGDGEWGVSANSGDNGPTKPTTPAGNASRIGDDGGITSATSQNSGRQKPSYGRVESLWGAGVDVKTPASDGASASKLGAEKTASDHWDAWGICARDGKVDKFTGADHIVTSTGSGRIASGNSIGSSRGPYETLKPLFYDDEKNRHQNYAANASPTSAAAATGGTLFPKVPHMAPLNAIPDNGKEDDIPRAGGFGGGASSPFHIDTARPTNTTPAGSMSSAPNYAYQPVRGPVGAAARQLKQTANPFTSQIVYPSSQKVPVAVVSPNPPTCQVTALGESTGPRARANSIAKPFVPPHMATPSRPVSDLPFRNMEHLERTPPPRGAEVFFDGKATESAVVDDDAPTPTRQPSPAEAW